MPPKSDLKKFQHAATSGLIFYFVAHPVTFKFVHSLTGKHLRVATKGGALTMTGVFVFSVIFTLVLFLWMKLYEKLNENRESFATSPATITQLRSSSAVKEVRGLNSDNHLQNNNSYRGNPSTRQGLGRQLSGEPIVNPVLL